MPKSLNILPNPALKPKVTDCALLEGDVEGWIVCCSQRFFPLARRIAGDDSLAEDVLQTSWIKILQSINQAYFDGPKACPWVSRIVTNTARDERREHRQRHEVPYLEGKDRRRPADLLMQERQMLRLLREMIRLLPNTYRQVIELRIYEGFSTQQTADLLHVSRSNVSTRLNRAVKLLQKRIDARIESSTQKKL